MDPQLRQHLVTPAERSGITEVLSRVSSYGVKVDVCPSNDGTTAITSTYDEVQRELTLGPRCEARVIVDCELADTIVGEPEVGPLLVVDDASGQIGVTRLLQRPKGVSTAKVAAPGDERPSDECVAAIERSVRAQLGDSTAFQQVQLAEGTPRPDSTFSHAVTGDVFVVRAGAEGALEWLPRRATQMRRTPLGGLLGARVADDGMDISQITERIKQAPVIVERQEFDEPPEAAADYVEQVLEGDGVVREWLEDQYQGARAAVVTEVAEGGDATWRAMQKKMPQERRSESVSDQSIAITAAVRVERKKRAVLREIGLAQFGNPPFDQFAQSYLPEVREEIQGLPEAEVHAQLEVLLRGTGKHYKRIANAVPEVQREELAWGLAKTRAQGHLISSATEHATREDLDATLRSLGQQQTVGTVERAARPARAISVVDAHGARIPSGEFFSDGGRSPFSIEEWCRLPTRPVIMPSGKPERGTEALATYLFENILYSPQVCDRNGRAVGMSDEKRQQYIDAITYAVTNGIPLTATQYMPLVAIGNPIKRNTQAPTLAEIDVVRRLSEISQAVELYYPPGMRWLIGNEAPAFQGPGFNLPDSYVGQFHNQMEAMMQTVDPEGRRMALFDEAEVLWGTPERAEQWHAYEAMRYDQLSQAYEHPSHPDHAAVADYINTYIYPMSTCVDPYRFEAAQGLSVPQIAEVYAAIKETNQSVIRGVAATVEGAAAPQDLTGQQQAFLHDLKAWALDLTYKYRVAMDSREELSAFGEVIPDHVLPFTMVTKRQKAVLFPNSAKGAYFPAHGEAVLLRPTDEKQRSVVTVRPWWQIASDPEAYQPMYVEGRAEPLYFEEARR